MLVTFCADHPPCLALASLSSMKNGVSFCTKLPSWEFKIGVLKLTFLKIKKTNQGYQNLDERKKRGILSLKPENIPFKQGKMIKINNKGVARHINEVNMLIK